MTATVHLVRHGKVHNPSDILYGRLENFGLSELGWQMAAAVADYFANQDYAVAAVWASPLQRAQETATPIAAAFGLPIITEPRVIEAGNIWEGQPLPKGPAEVLHPKNWWHLRNPWRPSWGEPYREQVERMWGAMQAAVTQQPTGHTVIVSHQLPIWIARSHFEGRSFAHDPRRRQCALASITSFSFENGTAVKLEYVEPAAHLQVTHET